MNETDDPVSRGIDASIDDITFSLGKHLKRIYSSAAGVDTADAALSEAVLAVLAGQIEDVCELAQQEAMAALSQHFDGSCPFDQVVNGAHIIL